MVQKLLRIFGKLFSKPELSSTKGSRLTAHEKKHLEGCLKRGGILTCPDCKGALLEGPSGGMSLNCCCDECGSEFNLSFWGDQAVFCERISDKGPRDPGERMNVYRGAITLCLVIHLLIT